MTGEGETKVLAIHTEPNTDAVSVRTASLYLSFVDGWGDEVALELVLMQKNANEALGVLKTFAQIRELYPNGGEVTEDYILEGVVVSNTEGGNAGENEQISASAIDYSGSKRTVYIQSLDGSLGFSLLTDTEEDNIFKQFNKVQVLLKGAEIYLFDQPARYYQIKGIRKSMVASNVKASDSDIVVKEKHFKDITDEDIDILLDQFYKTVEMILTTPVLDGYDYSVRKTIAEGFLNRRGGTCSAGHTMFSYDDASLKNHHNAPDVVWGYMSVMEKFDPFLYFPYLLGWYDKTSSALPTSMTISSGTGTVTLPLTYIFDEEGYVTEMKWTDGGSNKVMFTYR
jgi:hypothetical protein